LSVSLDSTTSATPLGGLWVRPCVVPCLAGGPSPDIPVPSPLSLALPWAAVTSRACAKGGFVLLGLFQATTSSRGCASQYAAIASDTVTSWQCVVVTSVTTNALHMLGLPRLRAALMPMGTPRFCLGHFFLHESLRLAALSYLNMQGRASHYLLSTEAHCHSG
jgi:hypothetical protein